jgi:hypothetical protein
MLVNYIRNYILLSYSSEKNTSSLKNIVCYHFLKFSWKWDLWTDVVLHMAESVAMYHRQNNLELIPIMHVTSGYRRKERALRSRPAYVGAFNSLQEVSKEILIRKYSATYCW